MPGIVNFVNYQAQGKFVNDILFRTIYKSYLYLTLGHHALAVILRSCLNFFELSTASRPNFTDQLQCMDAVLDL